MPREQAIVLTLGYPANMAEKLENPRPRSQGCPPGNVSGEFQLQ